MADNGSRKITRYPKNLNNINIGMIIFAVMALYIIISVITYMRKDHIIGYQVNEGSLSTNNIYEAIAIREEKIIASDAAGYVNYFQTEGSRVAVGNLVYTLDESGQLLEYLKSQGSEEVSLSDEDLAELRSQIVNFDSSFDVHDFYTVYDFKISLDGTVQKLANGSILENIQSLNEGSGSIKSINYKNSQDTGIVVYSVDGYEDLRLDAMTADKFDQTQYEKKQLINNNLVKAGDPVYKICTSEDWSVIIQVKDQDKFEEIKKKEEESGYIKVRFIKNQDESYGKVSTFTNSDGDNFVMLTFTNSMITFCRDRFLNIELITEDEKGLKIPNSSIVNKSFFIVPKDYVIKHNDGNFDVLKDKYDEQGNETSELVNISIYNETTSEYYIDNEVLRAGDILIKPDSNDRYTISKTDSLIGVYNINKGYPDFRQIKILYQNDEYSIVKSNTMYGLNAYDYIVLDSATVDKNGKNGKSDESDKSDSKEASSEEDSTAVSSEADSGDYSDEAAEEKSEEASSDSSEASSKDEASASKSGESAADSSSSASSTENKASAEKTNEKTQ
ncbi:HlyD family efflux transporter periplasmic adaptor subunit [Butyrivibrio sp. XB500-5]|uniref:HlyD family efflux transporter periplasmic adaptor subunit n=1 Tax=Butyrivibrio sp. XB500-5 TaxID=2364880 RepID=UPI0013147A88|nr:HlyD family efflux transporter periplasmic adaptor subunit [Butyrivibrio sp. XB500-5]